MSRRAPNEPPHAIDLHVGERIRTRRMLLGMGQEKLAQSIGVTFQQVQKYEKGYNRVSASRLYEIANVLGVAVAFFFEGAPQANTTGDPMHETKNIKVVHLFNQLKPHTQEHVVALMKAIATGDRASPAAMPAE